MIRALLLDLGETLIDANDQVLPGVRNALTQLRTFEAEDHQPLPMCLVSDFTMPHPRTPQAIQAAFADYLHILDQTGLREFFEPVDKHVTLSTHVGRNKPAAEVFETALARLGVAAPLTDTLFITENAAHVAACRQLGMHALQFGSDFTDWNHAPLRIAQEIGGTNVTNFKTMFKDALAAHDDLRLESLSDVKAGTLQGSARRLVKLDDPALGKLDGVHIELPVDLTARIDGTGRVASVETAPRPDMVAEAVENLKSLASNQQIAGMDEPGSPSPVVPTHSVETDAQGRRILRRRRFTAF